MKIKLELDLGEVSDCVTALTLGASFLKRTNRRPSPIPDEYLKLAEKIATEYQTQVNQNKN